MVQFLNQITKLPSDTTTSKHRPVHPFTSRGTRLIHQWIRWFLGHWNSWMSVVTWTQWLEYSLPLSTTATTLVSQHARGHLAITGSICAWMDSKSAPHMHRRLTSVCHRSPLCNWPKGTESTCICYRGPLPIPTTITPNSPVSCWRRTSSCCLTSSLHWIKCHHCSAVFIFFYTIISADYYLTACRINAVVD